MLKQDFSPHTISHIVNKDDIVRWRLWRDNTDKELSLKNLSDTINADDYKIHDVTVQNRPYCTLYQAKTKADHIALKLVNDYLKRIYKVKQSDRSRIVRQVKTLLTDGGDFHILKLDISSFYSSIDFSKMINQIENDMILGYKGIQILKSLNQVIKSKGENGLPMGICISATLSELLARNIDAKIKVLQGVFYYMRYVDDIVIFYDKSHISNITNKISEILSNSGHNLTINTSKQYQANLYDASFDFLGYSFKTSIINYKNHVEVKIAKGKINKIKTRIAKAFTQYKKDHSFRMLFARLRFLSAVKPLIENTNGTLYAGNTYNYQEISNCNSLKCLDGYLCAILNNQIIKGLSLSPSEVILLRKISFYRGFVHCRKVHYSLMLAKEIAKIWKYD